MDPKNLKDLLPKPIVVMPAGWKLKIDAYFNTHMNKTMVRFSLSHPSLTTPPLVEEQPLGCLVKMAKGGIELDLSDMMAEAFGL